MEWWSTLATPSIRLSDEERTQKKHIHIPVSAAESPLSPLTKTTQRHSFPLSPSLSVGLCFCLSLSPCSYNHKYLKYIDIYIYAYIYDIPGISGHVDCIYIYVFQFICLPVSMSICVYLSVWLCLTAYMYIYICNTYTLYVHIYIYLIEYTMLKIAFLYPWFWRDGVMLYVIQDENGSQQFWLVHVTDDVRSQGPFHQFFTIWQSISKNKTRLPFVADGPLPLLK